MFALGAIGRLGSLCPCAGVALFVPLTERSAPPQNAQGVDLFNYLEVLIVAYVSLEILE